MNRESFKIMLSTAKKLKYCFDSLPNDTKRWAWVFQHQNVIPFTIMIDNDSTYGVFDFVEKHYEDIEEVYEDQDSSDYLLEFNNYIGDSKGVIDLLDALCIKNERV